MHVLSYHSDAKLAEPFTGADARSRAAQFKRYMQNQDLINEEKVDSTI
jgi:hypothetical protein